MRQLASNQELYDYLMQLATQLERNGATALRDIALSARGHASMPTEFLGESRIALQAIARQENGALTGYQRDELLNVIAQLDSALR